MDKQNLITINNEKDNTLSFDVMFEGIEAEEKILRLVVTLSKPHTYLMMEFEHANNDAYKVTIPAKILPVGTHDCKIEVVANEHFFIAIEGNIKVTGAPKVSAKLKEEGQKKLDEPKVTISTPVLVSEEPKVEEKMSDDSIVMGSSQEEPIAVTESIVVPGSSNDDKVKGILSELGIQSKPKGKSLKTYLKS
jgi:hypothetical protein